MSNLLQNLLLVVTADASKSIKIVVWAKTKDPKKEKHSIICDVSD